jgi:hypothetical protein
MDPISIGAAVLTAIGVEVKSKATGAAAKWLTEAAQERAARLLGLIESGDAAALARRAVQEVMAEAVQYPPEKALLLRPLGTPVDAVGIWGPHGTLQLNLLWVNRADFPIHIRDLQVTVTAGGADPQWRKEFAEEFTLAPRGDLERMLCLVPRVPLPDFKGGGTNCDVTVSAVVCGPWEEGRAQRTQDLMPPVGIWLPVVGLDPAGFLDDVADIDVRLEHHLRKLGGGRRLEIIYAELDRELRLRSGATRDRLAVVAQRLAYQMNTSGPNVAIVHHPRAEPVTSNFLRRRNRMDGW